MDIDDALLEARFFLNMKRVGALVTLVAPRSPAAESDPLESDISRAVVVFLHATFEDLLRTAGRQRSGSGMSETQIPSSGLSYWEHVSFSSCHVVGKALLRMGLDAEPFKFLYPGLDSMMKRRHQVVHDADLPNATDREAPLWSFADNILLTYWLLHVLTFHAQLRVSLDPRNELQRWYLARRTKAIERARDMIRDLLRLAEGPKESQVGGFQVMSNQLMEVQALLGPPSEDELREIAQRMGIDEIPATDGGRA